jgi:cell division protein FtsX
MRRPALFLLAAPIAVSAAFIAVTAGQLPVFAAALHYVILQANTTVPPQLPGVLLVAVLLALMAAMAAWAIALYVRFRHVD